MNNSNKPPSPFMRMHMAIERISTGIQGLDSLIEGGIPKGFTVLIAGNPGTGKTILTSHFLYEGLKKGESGIYVSFSESKQQYLSNSDRLSMNFRAFKDGNPTFTFLDFTSVNKDGIADALDEVLRVISETKTKRMVIDSFSAVAQAFDNQNEARMALQVILGKITRAEGVTNMLIAEVPMGQSGVGSGIEEFVSDGIIKMEYGTGNASPLTIRVVKMRGTVMNREPHSISIRPEGMIVFTKYRPSLNYDAPDQRISSGNIGLDERIEGGLLRGSTTALIGASGVGKTTLSFQFIAEGVISGEAGIYCSLEESPAQINRMASKYGYNVEELESKGLTIVSRVAEDQNPDAFVSYLSDLIKEKRPKRLVIDSISAFEHSYEKDLYTLTKRLVSLSHDNELTTLFVILTSQQSGINLTTIGISSLFENIILLRYVEAEAKMKRSMLILKMRSSAHDESILEFTISENKGIRIIGAMKGYTGILTGVAQKVLKEDEEMEFSIEQKQQEERKRRFDEFQERERQIEEKQNISKGERRAAKDKKVKTLNKQQVDESKI